MKMQIALVILLCFILGCNNSENSSSVPVEPNRALIEGEQLKSAIGQFELRQFNAAIKEFKKYAAEGNSEAQYYLAYSYINGLGGNKDLKHGIEWLTKSSGQGNDKGMCLLGLEYLSGEGVDKDPQHAVSLLSESSQKGNVIAAHTLGTLNVEGKVMPKDVNKAIEYYKKAADKGFAPSQYSLGMLYLEDKEIPRDEEQAVKYLKLAAQTGDQDASLNFGKAIIMLLTKKLEKKPTNKLYAQRGLISYGIGMYDYARRDFYIACYGDSGDLGRQDAESLGCKAYMSMRLGVSLDQLVQEYRSTIPNM